MGHHAKSRSHTLNEETILEAGRLLFARDVLFQRGVAQLQDLPTASLPEIAFTGRSNVGKSSLINALCGRSGVARTSNTPGRTQELNFFNVDDQLTIVDMPGYGFAKAPKDKVEAWMQLANGYLKGRPTLRRCILLVDTRHGIKDNDRQMMDMLDQAAVVYQVVLTKSDKLKAEDVLRVLTETEGEIAKRVAAHPVVVVTSAEKGDGIAQLRGELVQLRAERQS